MSFRKHLEERLQGLQEEFPGHLDDYRRQLIIEAAEEAADRIIVDGANGDVRELDYLTAVVAEHFAAKVLGRLRSELLKADLTKRQPGLPL